MEIAAAISSFLTHVQVEKGLATNTLSAYRRDLAKFEDFSKKRKLAPAAAKSDDLAGFLASPFRQKLGRQTGARPPVTPPKFFPHAQVSGVIREDPDAEPRS